MPEDKNQEAEETSETIDASVETGKLDDLSVEDDEQVKGGRTWADYVCLECRIRGWIKPVRACWSRYSGVAPAGCSNRDEFRRRSNTAGRPSTAIIPCVYLDVACYFKKKQLLKLSQ